MSQIEIVFQPVQGGGPGCIKIVVTENGDRLWSMTYHGGEVMTYEVKQNFLELCSEHYFNQLTTKRARTEFLDQIMPLLKYKKRKSLIRALNEFESEKVIRKRGRSQSYNDIHLAILKQVWTGMNYACGKRIAAALPEWLKRHKTCSDQIRDRLVNMGAATIDRALKPAKTHRNGHCCSLWRLHLGHFWLASFKMKLLEKDRIGAGTHCLDVMSSCIFCL